MSRHVNRPEFLRGQGQDGWRRRPEHRRWWLVPCTVGVHWRCVVPGHSRDRGIVFFFWVIHRSSGDDMYASPVDGRAVSGLLRLGVNCFQAQDTDQLTEFESDDFVDFMFATGDLKKWMVMAKDQVYGTYNNGERDIKSSWQNAGPHKARMYRRRGHNEDPWISDTDHGTAVRNDDSNAVLYGENNFKSNRHAYNVRYFGFDVGTFLSFV